MAYCTIEYEVTENVAEIFLDQPERHNPLGSCIEDLIDALERARNDDSAHVVLLSGNGESFSAGGDIDDFADRLEDSAPEIFDDGRATSVKLFQLLSEYDKPIVGGINGSAFGGGTGLVASCHIAYASDEARFGTTEISIGLFPMIILPTLRRTLGDSRTLELALTGERISAAEAAEIGLVTDVFEPDQVLEAAREMARTIAEYSPFALSLGLRSFNETTDLPDREAIQVLNAYRVLFFKSHDLNEGARAFLEDREPVWEGR
jgi:methylglutaconyl-CoA hydratase